MTCDPQMIDVVFFVSRAALRQNGEDGIPHSGPGKHSVRDGQVQGGQVAAIESIDEIGSAELQSTVKLQHVLRRLPPSDESRRRVSQVTKQEQSAEGNKRRGQSVCSATWPHTARPSRVSRGS